MAVRMHYLALYVKGLRTEGRVTHYWISSLSSSRQSAPYGAKKPAAKHNKKVPSIINTFCERFVIIFIDKENICSMICNSIPLKKSESGRFILPDKMQKSSSYILCNYFFTFLLFTCALSTLQCTYDTFHFLIWPLKTTKEAVHIFLIQRAILLEGMTHCCVSLRAASLD